MIPDFPEPPPPPPPADPASKPGGRLRLFGIGLGIAIAGATAGLIVTHASPPSTANTTAAASTPSTSPSAHKPSFGGHGGFGFACGAPFAGAGFGGPSSLGGGFCGGEAGTVTKISGSTLTLRTLAGTVTITTTASTTYTREEQTVKFSALKVGDVVAVRGKRSVARLTPKTVQIFRHDWPLDSTRAIADRGDRSHDRGAEHLRARAVCQRRHHHAGDW